MGKICSETDWGREGQEQTRFSLSPFMGGVAARVMGSDSPPQAGHAVHGHAASGVFAELGLQQVEPIFHYLAGRRRSIIKRPILQGRGKVRGREKHQTLSDPGERLRELLFPHSNGVWDHDSGESNACAQSRAHTQFCGVVVGFVAFPQYAGIPRPLWLRVCSQRNMHLGLSHLLWTGSAFRSTYRICNVVPISSCLCRSGWPSPASSPFGWPH